MKSRNHANMLQKSLSSEVAALAKFTSMMTAREEVGIEISMFFSNS